MDEEIAEQLQNSGVFDLPDAEGVNRSERRLADLCRRSFLSLWSYPNLHTDEDFRDGKGSAKELCDVLAVFGNDIVIFSDKHIAFQADKQIEVAWPRWYKRAVAGSVRQLQGAMNWLLRFPNRVFMDARCTRPLPVQLPPMDRARFHLVAVTRGSYDACARAFPGSYGSLKINTGITGDAHLHTPFNIGVVNEGRQFVHVLDEMSLEVVLGELDTVADLVTYLVKREEFLADQHRVVNAPGEEQLLAAYLLQMADGEHSFLGKIDGCPNLIVFDETHYKGLRQNPGYVAKKEADRDSYVWDRLVEHFIRLGDPAMVHPDIEQANHETEQALRAIAGESRFRRRLLVTTITDLLRVAVPGKARARLLHTEEDADLVYIFLIVPKREDESFDEYRRHRVSMLHAYCRCSKLKFPAATKFVGMGFDHPVRSYKESSEDLIMFIPNDLTDEGRAELESRCKDLGILGDGLTLTRVHADEFPYEWPAGTEEVIAGKRRADEKERKRKRKEKMAKTSKRRNRK